MPRAIVEKWLTDSRDSYRINWSLVEAGLKPAVVSGRCKKGDGVVPALSGSDQELGDLNQRISP